MKIFKFLSLTGILCFAIGCSNFKGVKYEYVGKFKYSITNDSLFSNTYLYYDSYGYLIGDLQIQGIKIHDIKSLNIKSDYIISLGHPVRAVYSESKKIYGEGNIKTKKIPIDILIDTTMSTNDIYLYKLFSKDKYRLLLP
jgi:hypothetical protein